MHTHNNNPQELEHFAKSAPEWWDPLGPNQLLHQLNPVRLHYLMRHSDLKNKKILDIGCGGGIFSESLAIQGAHVTGLDLSEDLIMMAKIHQLESHLTIDYQLQSAEDHALQYPEAYDIITCMEMLEHVPNPQSILYAISHLLKPNGSVLLSTLDRSPISFLTAIVGGEYLLKKLPKGTHHYDQFIRPGELTRALREAGLTPLDIQGVRYNLLKTSFEECSKTHVNYLVLAQKCEH